MEQTGKQRKIGLARALSKLGYCSRSNASELIPNGQVTLNGKVRRDPETPTHPTQDRILVNGHPLKAEPKIYLLLNKPRGVITTTADEKGRETVYKFLQQHRTGWLAPVGRLDKASEGLLLFTNDSEWAARLLAPETHLEKTYHVRVDAPVDDALLSTIIGGIKTQSGLLKAKRAQLIRGGDRRSWLEIVLDEGKNRHIRRMFEQLGIQILRLLRVAIGPLTLGELPKGSVRPLTDGEKKALDNAMKSQRVRG
jgi:23S rRNA pseudouridine2605 synthase